ncbi:MAG: MBL fold metallo-hydrolase [Chloroflexi bacterium]|nr:MBL fold metallo-hydrolase [Chloroflexota bacterium]
MSPTTYEFHELASGVHVAIAPLYSFAGSNAGIVDLGGRVLVFDTGIVPLAGQHLAQAAEDFFGRAPDLVINSHWHADHVQGNQVFPAATPVISTHITRALIAANVPDNIADLRRDMPQAARDIETRLANVTDAAERAELGEELAWFQTAAEQAAALELRLPDQTFEQRVCLYGAVRRAELVTFGGGHTASDAVLWLPDDNIVFVADLLFHGFHPFLGDGDPDQWLRIYTDLEALDPLPEVVVPGHGKLATPAAFADLRRYVPTLRELVADLKLRGGTADDAVKLPVPAAFSDWEGPNTFARNMTFLFEQAEA